MDLEPWTVNRLNPFYDVQPSFFIGFVNKNCSKLLYFVVYLQIGRLLLSFIFKPFSKKKMESIQNPFCKCIVIQKN